MSFKIESLKEKDVEETAKAILQYMQPLGRLPPPFQDSKTIGRMIFGPNVATLIARKDEKIVGIISGIAVLQAVGGMSSLQPRIELMITDAESAKEKLDSMLVAKFLEQIKNQFPNASGVVSTVPVPVPEAYSANGFAFSGFVREVLQGREVLFVLLRKVLDRSTTPVT